MTMSADPAWKSCEHHWVASHQPDFPDPIYWIRQCSLCGHYDGTILTEQLRLAKPPMIRAQIADDINTAANTWLAAHDARGPGPNGQEYDHGNVNGFIDGIHTAKRIVRGDT